MRSGFFQAHANLGLVLTRMFKPGEALKSYRNALDIRPSEGRIAAWMGSCYMTLSDYDSAETRYINAQELGYRDSDMLRNLGIIHANRNAIDDAQAYFQQAATLDSTDAESYYRLAEIYDQKGNVKQAAKYYFRSLRFKPDYASAYYKLSRMYSAQGRTDEAEKLLETFDHWKKYERELAEVQVAYQNNPRDPDAAYALGMTYLRCGQQRPAEHIFEDLLRIWPEHDLANEQLDKIRGYSRR